MTPNLTIAERKWIEKVEKLLDNPPSQRLAAYTFDGTSLYFYDANVLKKWVGEQPKTSLDKLPAMLWYKDSNSQLCEIYIKFPIELLSW